MVNAIKKAMKENGSDKKVKELLKKIFKDDNAVDAALDVIAKGIAGLELSEDCLKKPTPEETLLCFMALVKRLPKMQQRAVWRELAKTIAIENNKDIAATDADKLDFVVQLAYSLNKHQTT
jgi:hypothetical protein